MAVMVILIGGGILGVAILTRHASRPPETEQERDDSSEVGEISPEIVGDPGQTISLGDDLMYSASIVGGVFEGEGNQAVDIQGQGYACWNPEDNIARWECRAIVVRRSDVVVLDLATGGMMESLVRRVASGELVDNMSFDAWRPLTREVCELYDLNCV
ncbi:hypothetical protein FWC63_00240 [Candidatus Saccharibacteria bacterium]|nr:hypothetical protein [Candidatus Saccharibacteria bacterium]